MTADDLLILAARWLHIVAATLAVGVPIFARLSLLPALQNVDSDTASRLREAIAKRWRITVYVAIVVFLATGFYNFLGSHASWRKFRDSDPDKMRLYHALIGVKLLLAFAMFFLSSALAGRSAALAYFRNHARGWTAILVLLGLAVVAISNYLRFLSISAN